jgi:hypothetical protein
MADIKNFSMAGVASSVQFGKRGAQLKQAADAFAFRKSDDSAFALVKVAFPTEADHATTKQYVDQTVGAINTARIQDAKTNPTSFVGTAEAGQAGKVVIAANTTGTDTATVARFQSGAAANSNIVFDNATLDTVKFVAEGTSANVNIQLQPKGTGIVEIGNAGDSSMLQADEGSSLVIAGGDKATAVGGDLIMRAGMGMDGASHGAVKIQAGDSTDLITFATTQVLVHNKNIVDLADGVAAKDAVNKSQLDAVATAAAANVQTNKIGSLQTREFDVGTSTVNIGDAVKGRIRRVMVRITTAYSAGGNINVGHAGDQSALVTSTEVDETAVGTYELNSTDVTFASATQLVAYVSGTPAAGAAKIIVEYIQG